MRTKNYFTKFFFIILIFSNLNNSYAQADKCQGTFSGIAIEIKKLEVNYTQPDPIYNPGKCNAEVRILGKIKNNSKETLYYLQLGTDARPNETIDIGLNNLKSGKVMNFNITHTFTWINCGSVNELMIMGNSAGIPTHTPICQFTSNQVLPVELIYFDYSSETRTLEWETAAEINNEGFDIEFSRDGITWTSIAFVSGLGNSDVGQEYYYTLHADATSGYYRLKQMDFDGSYSHSTVIYVEDDRNPIGLGQVYPNPAQDVLYTSDKEIERIDIFDLSGRFIRQSMVQDGEIEVADLQPGMYLAILQKDAFRQQVNFIKG